MIVIVVLIGIGCAAILLSILFAAVFFVKEIVGEMITHEQRDAMANVTATIHNPLFGAGVDTGSRDEDIG
jgi:hypothetical protein